MVGKTQPEVGLLEVVAVSYPFFDEIRQVSPI